MTASPKRTDAPQNGTLPDHDYDGIHEEDNPLPRWWVNLFLVAILFSVVYLPVMHILNFLPHSELRSNMAQAARLSEQRELELEASGALDKDPVAAGQKYFKTFCVSCHGTHAEGGIGPNLTDAFWLHTPYEDSIRTVIMNGVAAKGMPTWGPVLGERKVKSISAYVTSLWQAAPPVAGKKAEGEKYDMEAIRKTAPATEMAADTAAAKKS